MFFFRYCCGTGGGGGGGYWGGGAGICNHGGGGGSSYYRPTDELILSTAGMNNGNGNVTIVPIVPYILYPTSQPSMRPSKPSSQPTMQPTEDPSSQPTIRPSLWNSNPKAGIPTGQPTQIPSMQPSQQPSEQPTTVPSLEPSSRPTTLPTWGVRYQCIITTIGSNINGPRGMVVDTSSNVYFAVSGDNQVRVLTRASVLVTIAGTGIAGSSGDGGKATSAQLNNPNDVTIDTLASKLFIADYNNNKIRLVTFSTGIITTYVGTGIVGSNGDGSAATLAQLNGPSGVVIDINGNLYISDRVNYKIRMVSSAGIISTVAGIGTLANGVNGGMATSTAVGYPTALALDSAGNLYIADSNYCKIRLVVPSGIVTTVAGSGSCGTTGDGGPATSAKLSSRISSVAVDLSGNIYITDWLKMKIRVVNSAGIISNFAGTGLTGYNGDGIPATLATLNTPDQVGVDAKG